MRKQDKFLFALAVSSIVHLLLLWPAASFHRQGEAAQPLSVVLQPRKGELPDVAATVAAKLAPMRTLLARAAEPSLQSDPRPDNTPASTTEMPLRSEGQQPGAAARAAPAASTGASGTLDADGVRQYRMALAVEARRFKRYPPIALAEEISGTVEVRVAVAAGGQTQEVALARSSGYEALDDAALDMLRKAAPRTAVPELLRRRPFVIDLPVVFNVASE